MTDWSGKNVFVTGADGFIGSHLTAALVEAGANVTALALYNSFDSHGWLDDLDPSVRAAIEMVRGDVRDAHQMMTLCTGKDTVLHLAALISVPFSFEAPTSFVDTNVTGTVNVLTAARDNGVARVVNTSTSEVYGTAQTRPITEDHVLQAQSPYAASKIAADKMAEAFARTYSMNVVTLRPFNTYGPRQSERAVISTTIRQALDPACEEIRLGDLRPGRDFNFVQDTARAFLAAAMVDDRYSGQVFNAGSGHMVTIGETADAIVRLSGSNKPIVHDADRMRPADSEVMALIADASRFTDASGWTSEVALEDGLARTIDWWRSRLDRVRPGSDYIV